jgi:predicted GNAT superfamily acetyltransferase
VVRIRIKPLTKLAEFEACVAIQREVWSHGDLDITPVHQFCISFHTGAILLGAFSGGTLAGYVYSFPAVVEGRFCQHSHHLAVLPRHQGMGLGRSLKWAQRDEALRRGCSLITWTYDPLLARNANLNLRTLGAMGGIYLRNFYGFTPALVLDDGVPTDRLLVEWRIDTVRVSNRRERRGDAPDPSGIVKALERKPGGVFPEIAPRGPVLGLAAPRLLVEIPPNVRDMETGTGLIAAWQAAVRRALEHYFKRGYALDDFIFGDRCFYVLKYTEKRGLEPSRRSRGMRRKQDRNRGTS